MKSVSITTIICGTALILAPLVHDILVVSMIAKLMAEGSVRVNLTGNLGNSYMPWCMFIGVCVIISGLVMGWHSHRAAELRPVVIPPPNAAPVGA